MNTTRRLVWMAFLLMLATGLATAQGSKKESPLRTVMGAVTDKSDNPLPGGVVFLKNLRTGTINSRFADKDGNYRFSGLDPNVDYEIHAELGGAKSPTKTVSSLDGRKEILLNLKIDRKKS
jgi:Carboxypeptidase regulatory-like domain